MSVGTSNPAEPQPYAPQGLASIGKNPVGGAGGERGTSAFVGNSEFNPDGTLKATVINPSQGSRRGIDYYTGYNLVMAGQHNPANTPKREAATKPPVV